MAFASDILIVELIYAPADIDTKPNDKNDRQEIATIGPDGYVCYQELAADTDGNVIAKSLNGMRPIFRLTAKADARISISPAPSTSTKLKAGMTAGDSRDYYVEENSIVRWAATAPA